MFAINYRDPRPVYEQIVDGIRTLIITGVFAPDQRLPSVRELASELAINPNTIQRAYRELEISGYLYSVPGKGNYAGAKQEVDSGRKDALLKTLRDTVRELRWLGYSEGELLALLREEEPEDSGLLREKGKDSGLLSSLPPSPSATSTSSGQKGVTEHD